MRLNQNETSRCTIKQGAALLAGIVSGVAAASVDAIPDEPDALCLVVTMDVTSCHDEVIQATKWFEEKLGLPVVIVHTGAGLQLMRKSDAERFRNNAKSVD